MNESAPALLDLRPISPALGAEVHGLDEDTLTDESVIAALKSAFLAYHVLVFRDLPLSRAAHKDLAGNFGELHIHPSRRAPGFKGDREIFRVHADETTVLNNGGLWHADVTCDERPPLGSMLRLTTVPRHGGDTLFANMHLAYELLSEPIRTLLEGLHATHDQQLDVSRYGIDVPADHEWVRTEHPVVVAHPETQRKLLYVNRAFTTGLAGVTKPESDALLELLFDHIASTPVLQCRIRWEPDTLVFWDNRCTQHHAVWDYFPQTRTGERVTIASPVRPSA